VPDTVLAQLSNRFQHALRAYTPRETKAVKAAADTFRPNPDFDCYEAITKLGTGEALVSTLEDKGVPSMVQRTLIRPPASRLGPVTADERKALMGQSPVAGQYDETIDRESAFEVLHKKVNGQQPEQSQGTATDPVQKPSTGGGWTLPDFGSSGPAKTSLPAPRGSGRQTVAEAAMKSVVRSVSSSLGRALVRGILGSLSRR
jgi:uncharacterized protein